jgi:dUTP pyrophosphatase
MLYSYTGHWLDNLKMPLFFRMLNERATLPSRRSALAAGYDLHCIEGFDLDPADQVICKIGISVEIPEGHYGRLASRPGLAARFSVAVLGGIVDGDYRGEIEVTLINLGSETVAFRPGSRVAQLIIERISTPEPAWAHELLEGE